jgi:serine/threonine-protein kinase PknG
MARCDRPDCGLGEVDEQGFCSACDRRPLRQPLRQPLGIALPEADRVAASAEPVRSEPWWGLGLVTADVVPETAEGPMDFDTTIAEDERYCAHCGFPIGRGHDGASGRVKGFCTRCGEPFDFARTRVGELVAGRYEIKRKLGAGAFGAALLAYDRNLGTDVVLKDLTRSVAETARLERDALVGLRHDSIVRIYGYQPEGPYLVLEYVRGTPLSERAEDRLEVILVHGLQILQALDYLHARGLLHIDVKPENIIRFGEQGADGPRDRVRLIDFGSVWKLGNPGPVISYTPAYAPPKTDSEHALPTVGFDLFCVGSTLQALSRQHRRDPAAPGIAALERLLRRATDTDTPQRRFVSAGQFAEQLSGVIRQVVATAPTDSKRITRPSALFGRMTEPLHGGLGEPRPLRHWIAARLPQGNPEDRGCTMAAPLTTPTPADVVAALPAPLADPDDPARTQARQAWLVACRTALRRRDPAQARRSLGQTRLPEWFWISSWYAGLIALAGGDTVTAEDHFGAVRDTLPGELIPLLALALCAEIRADLSQARRHYEAVVGTAPALGVAGFGLARTYLLAGRRAEAVAAAERLAGELQAQELGLEHAARIAVVRLLAAVTGSCVPAEADLIRAGELTDELQASADVKLGLRAEIQYGRASITGDWLPLSEMIPDLAKLATSKPDFFAMMDLANRLRPPIEWRWRRALRRTRDRLAVGT